ncbi:MAG: hypothetical protein WCI73_15725 [Phycisphaerae bacterium]
MPAPLAPTHYYKKTSGVWYWGFQYNWYTTNACTTNSTTIPGATPGVDWAVRSTLDDGAPLDIDFGAGQLQPYRCDISQINCYAPGGISGGLWTGDYIANYSGVTGATFTGLHLSGYGSWSACIYAPTVTVDFSTISFDSNGYFNPASYLPSDPGFATYGGTFSPKVKFINLPAGGGGARGWNGWR